jgi:glutamyl-tRNA synthetase
MTEIRTRFAPSPTGFLHVGGLRTALYAYLYAKKHNGKFLLRIEDTDQNRLVEGATENLIATLRWAGLDFDEGPTKEGQFGPYVQSQCLPRYKQCAQQLIEAGHAYYCFCSTERLEIVRQQQTAAKLPTRYDQLCRKLDPVEAKKRVEAGEKHVVRMKVPVTGELTFNDLIRGPVTFAYKNVDDQVIIKSDGFPTYHLASVVDDHYMQISHIIRGEEWLSSTPKHVLLYQYLGWTMPQIAHLPLLLNPDKSKLSKRQGDVAVEDYRDKGYLKEALINFVALLGWNPGDTREVFSLEQLVQEFSLERVGKSGAVFDVEKLKWMNEQHMRLKTDDDMLELVKPILQEKHWGSFPDEYLKQVFGLMRERVTFPQDYVETCPYFYKDPHTFDEAAKAKSWTEQTPGLLNGLLERYKILNSFDAATVEQELRQEAEKQGISAGKFIHPLRLALTGVAVGASLFHVIEILGKDTVVRRLEFAIKSL